MICTKCQKVYQPAPHELGSTSTLAGQCIDCLTEPKYLPFGSSFAWAAVSSILSVEMLLIWLLTRDSTSAALSISATIVVSAAVYVLARRSESVTYESEGDRLSSVRWQKVVGSACGLAFGIFSFVSFLNLVVSDTQ